MIQTACRSTPTLTVTVPIYALVLSGFPFPYLRYRDRYWSPWKLYSKLRDLTYLVP